MVIFNDNKPFVGLSAAVRYQQARSAAYPFADLIRILEPMWF